MSTPAPPHLSEASFWDTCALTADERIHHLIEWLRSGQKLTTPLAADAFGVSRRTIARDLAHLREVLALDVTFEPTEHSYVLAEEHTALPFLAFPNLVPTLLGARPTTSQAKAEQSPAPVSVRFSARAIQAYLARGGRIPDGAVNDDGTLDACFSPQNRDEFMCYVLSRGHDIEVLAPPDLRRRVHMEIRRMLTIYASESSADA